MHLNIWALLLCGMGLGSVGQAQAGQPIRLCDDQSGWPPYAFSDPKNPSTTTGASVELMFEVLKRAGYEPQLSLLPWKRCLLQVEKGTIDIVLHASLNEERRQKFLVSQPYYHVTSGLFYVRSKFPKPPAIATVAAMRPYRYCGLLGYNYAMYDLPESQLDSGSKDESSRLEKLRLGRCDFVLGDVEILKGFAAMGKINLNDLSFITIPGIQPIEFHALVSKSSDQGTKLLQQIDEGIVALKADKTYAKIFKKYGI